VKKKDKEPTTFKEMVSRLEEIAETLDSDNLDLEQAIALYEEGVQLSETCIKSLKDAELKISSLKDKLSDLQKS
jgi:exodeoxyribonuclease VII small subunit